ncbi:ciliary microtubule inner protein 2C-like [Watersipora subatra]|uniref:ciliary microtubule inner protein 2C-like n=1 Tax=Watersipora subatra TaxID=2589382 RepID=UPI00355C6C25
MASRSAGTLITTHNSAYVPPALMPGYRGHVPSLKYDYGETYGHETRKYFQDYRSACLNKSSYPLSKGGDFPTNYSHDPSLVISNRSRTRDRFLAQPQYQLINQHYDRTRELTSFNMGCQKHREHYNDKSGTIERSKTFMVPTRAEDQFKDHVPFMVLSTRHTDDIYLPNIGHSARRLPLIPHYNRDAVDKHERRIRDVYFERR